MRKQVTRQFALVAGLVLALTACSTDSEPGGTNASGGEDAGTEADIEMGPLSQALDSIWGGGEWDEDQAIAENRMVEEAIAVCMAEQGFEYIPVDYSQNNWGAYEPGFEEDPNEPEWGTVAHAEKYGYSITYWELNKDEDSGIGAQLIIGEEDEYFDPNAAIVEAMSETETLAYYAALYGSTAGWTEEQWEDYSNNIDENGEWIGAGEDPFLNPDGCSNEAYAAIAGEDKWQIMMEDPDYVEFEELMTEFYENQGTSPRLSALEAEWSACMAEAGYTYSKMWDPQEEFYAEWEILQAPRWEEMETIDWDAPNAEEKWDEIYNKPIPGIDEFADKEYATAIADAKCGEKLNLLETQEEIYLESELEFYNTNKTLIDDLTARYGEGA